MPLAKENTYTTKDIYELSDFLSYIKKHST